MYNASATGKKEKTQGKKSDTIVFVRTTVGGDQSHEPLPSS
jgi:hypothetical protein